MYGVHGSYDAVRPFKPAHTIAPLIRARPVILHEPAAKGCFFDFSETPFSPLARLATQFLRGFKSRSVYNVGNEL
mgnify:CR=1 FL=1